MRILDINNRIPFPLRDGGAISIYGMLKEMHRQHLDVTFFTLNTSKHFQPAEVMSDIVNKIHAPYIDNRVTPLGALRSLIFPPSLVPYGMEGVASYWIDRFLDEKILADLIDVVVKEGPFDIVQSESIFVAPYAIALRRKGIVGPGTRLVLRSHNIEHQIQARLAQEEGKNVLEKWYRRKLASQTESFERRCAMYFDEVATVTEADELYFMNNCPGLPTCTIQPGTPIPDRSEVESMGAVVPMSICLLASLEWSPNVEGAHWFVHKVMPLVNAVIPSATVHIAGRNPSQDALALHNGTTVIVHGEVPDAAEFRRRHAISVVPLFSGSGLRMKILEALALQTTVVSTSVGAEGIDLTPGKHFVLADSEHDFANACIDLLRNPDKANTIARNGRDLAEGMFGWPRRVHQFMELYERVAAKPSTRLVP